MIYLSDMKQNKEVKAHNKGFFYFQNSMYQNKINNSKRYCLVRKNRIKARNNLR